MQSVPTLKVRDEDLGDLHVSEVDVRNFVAWTKDQVKFRHGGEYCYECGRHVGAGPDANHDHGCRIQKLERILRGLQIEPGV